MLLRKNKLSETKCVFLFISLFFSLAASSQRFTEEVEEGGKEAHVLDLQEYSWLYLSSCILLFFVITMVLFYLLYSPVSRWALMRAYKTKGISVPAYVVSSEFLSDSYATLVIYSVSSGTIASAGYNIEFTGGHTKKRYVRSFEFADEYDPGSILEMIYLPEKGESGIPKDEVHEIMSGYSIIQTVLTILFGIPLLTLVLIFAFYLCQYEERADEVLAFSIILTILIGYFLSAFYWNKEKNDEYFGAEELNEDMEKALVKMTAKDPKKIPLLA